MADNSRMRSLTDSIVIGNQAQFLSTKNSTAEWSCRKEKQIFGGTGQNDVERDWTTQILRVDAVSTACYVLNRVLIRLILKKTLYTLFRGRKPNLSHLNVFGCKCFILNNRKDNLGKFDSKSDEGIFLGYSQHGHAYCVYNKRTMLVEEYVHVNFD